MDKDGTAAAGNAGPRIVIDFDYKIIEMIVAKQAVASFIGGALERTIIAAVVTVLAPGNGRTDAAHRQQSARARQAILSPPQPYRVVLAARRAAIALPLVGPNAGAAECHGHHHSAGKQPALGSSTRPGTDADSGERNLSHT